MDGWDWISERTYAMSREPLCGAYNTAGKYENVEDVDDVEHVEDVEDDDDDANRVVEKDPLV